MFLNLSVKIHAMSNIEKGNIVPKYGFTCNVFQNCYKPLDLIGYDLGEIPCFKMSWNKKTHFSS